MAAPALYWRIGIRDSNAATSAPHRLPLTVLTVHTTGGTNVTSSATVTTTFTNLVGTLSLLNDGSDSTQCELGWTTSTSTNVFNYVTYQFASETLLDYFTLRSSASVAAGSRVSISGCNFIVQSSADNITWVTQAALSRPAAADATTYLLPMTYDSLYYQFTDRTSLGGAGGIYGIVSEDGVALPNRPVYLYERDAFQRIGYTTTDANGGYAFNGLNTNREFMVMSVDPSGPPYKNALIWDRITPINTLGNLAPQSPFWARRLRDPAFGNAVAHVNILDGATYNYYTMALGGQAYNAWNTAGYDGLTVDSGYNGNGLYTFLKSNRVAGNNGTGFTYKINSGKFGANTLANTVLYTALSFEYIVTAPTSAEGDLVIQYSFTRDSDEFTGFVNAASANHVPRGPSLQVTSTAINVRFPLGTNNLATIRATAPVVQGQTYHVVVTYVQDTEIKLYVNGALIQTASIAGAGRIWTYCSYTNDFSTDWNQTGYVGGGAGRRIYALMVFGSGNYPGSYAGTGWGGRYAYSGYYGRVLSATDVTNLYDSYVNPTTHTVLTTQSGYAGEVEADNPYYYLRLNDLAIPASTLSWPLIGRKDQYVTHRSANVYGVTGFTSGTTAMDFSASTSAGLIADAGLDNTMFTIECFVRPTSLAATGTIYSSRIYNSLTPVALFLLTSGLLRLDIGDQSGVTTSIAFSHTALATNTSYHIAVTYDPWGSKEAKLYINGALASTIASTSIPSLRNTEWTGIGINPSGTGPSYSDNFRGAMGEFALYNYALSAARIQAHYDARNS